MSSKWWIAIAVGFCIFFSDRAYPQTTVSEPRLRDELLRHFSQDNLLPVFLPRNHEVGDVMDTNGAVYAKWTQCFPTLRSRKGLPTDTLRYLSVNMKAEGNFGIGLKRIVDLVFSAQASSATKLTLLF